MNSTALYPSLVQAMAAEHVRDMRAQADAARQARAARRGRRARRHQPR